MIGPYLLLNARSTSGRVQVAGVRAAALDAGVPLRDVQEAVSHAVSKTTVRYDPPAPVSTYTVMGTAACCYGVRG